MLLKLEGGYLLYYTDVTSTFRPHTVLAEFLPQFQSWQNSKLVISLPLDS